MTDNTTADYINGAFESYNATAGAMLDAEREGVECEDGDPSEAIDNYALSIDTRIHVEISLTLGGPNVWIDAEVSKSASGWSYELADATFHAAWGGDRVKRTLSTSDPLYTLAERYIESAGDLL